MDLTDLTRFIVTAKRATYVGDGEKANPSRPGSHDLTFAQGAFMYRDSYFGGTDFIGQEVVWHEGEPVWAMNYYGYILRPDLIDGARAGATIKAASSEASAGRGHTAPTKTRPREIPRTSGAASTSLSVVQSPMPSTTAAG
jgi:hypothetical protein